MDKKTLVLGASPNENRYSYRAIEALAADDFSVVAIGARKGMIGVHKIETSPIDIPDLHTVTLYIRPSLQKQYYKYIIAQNPKRIIFNPGTENPYFETLAKNAGIEVVVGCTLVMLCLNQY